MSGPAKRGIRQLPDAAVHPTAASYRKPDFAESSGKSSKSRLSGQLNSPIGATSQPLHNTNLRCLYTAGIDDAWHDFVPVFGVEGIRVTFQASI
jgi:hypothetical protein